MFDAIPIYETKCHTTKPANVRKLIAWLREGRGPRFDMRLYLQEDNRGIWGWDEFYGVFLFRLSDDNWCGTSACIAGHAIILGCSEKFEFSRCGDFVEMAGEYLGITPKPGGLFTLHRRCG